MLSIVTRGVNEAIKAIENDKKQARFAAAVALTRTAKIAADAEKKEAAKDLDSPTPFTLRGFRFSKATKANLQSSVYIMPIQSQYLAWQIEGGRRQKRARVGEALPVNVAINKYGNIVGRGTGKLKKLISRPDTFIGTVRGVHGLWQRGGITNAGKFRAAGTSRKRNVQSKRLTLLVRFVPAVQYRPKFDFYATAERTFHKHFEKEFDKALTQARATAR